jgi:uroporphyrinogen decarboxylase
VHETGYVFYAIKLTKEMLDDEVPLIGFAGSPGQLCYGQGSKSFDKAKGFCFSHQAAHVYCKKLPIRLFYIYKKKVKAGVDAVQVLILGAECCLQLIIKILLEIHQSDYRSLADHAPVIVFLKDVGLPLNEMGKSRASALGVDGLTKKCKIFVRWKYHFG